MIKEAPVVRSYPLASLHLVRNPFLPAYLRYYDFVGLVVPPLPPHDLVEVYVYGPVEQYKGQLWALKRKPRERER
jgi:hypothetical protein